jgi:hypothetical protein
MEEKHEDEEIWTYSVRIDVERSNENKEEDGDNRHLSKYDRPLFVFFCKKETVEDKSQRNRDEDGKKSYEREYVGKDDRCLK